MVRVLAALFVTALVACAATPDPRVDLEERILSPCCWRESIYVHDSPIAASLRAEVEARLAQGEPAQAIEDSFVARYGDKIRALPRGADPRWQIGTAAAGFALLALALVFARARRRPPSPALSSADESVFDEQLDDELAAMAD